MVDPARRVAAIERVDHVPVIEVEVKRVVGILRVMRMAFLRLCPGDHLALVLDDDFALDDRLCRKHPFAVHAGAVGLKAAHAAANHFFGHFGVVVKNLIT